MKVFKSICIVLSILILAIFMSVMFLPVDKTVASFMARIDGYDVSEYDDNINRYYYNKLTDDEKLAYRIICEAAVDFKTTIVVPALSTDQVADVYKAIRYDNPEYFFLGNQCTISSFGSVYTFVPQYLIRESDYSSYNYRLKQACEELYSLVDESMSDYEIELFIHDYVAEHCNYSDDGSALIYTMYGVLVDGSANCEGYSKTAQWLLTKCGIENHIAVGSASADGATVGDDNRHMWNVVKIDGNWYNMDITWDDTLIKDEDSNETSDTLFDNRASHVYFNISSKDLLATHAVDSEDIWSLCTSESYGYFKDNGLLFSGTNDAAMAKQIAATVDDGYASIEFRFETQSEYKSAYSRLAQNGGIYYIYKTANTLISCEKRINTTNIITTYNDEAQVIRFFFIFNQ